MPRVTFSEPFTYRSITLTVSYPAGTFDVPQEVADAARAAGKLEKGKSVSDLIPEARLATLKALKAAQTLTAVVPPTSIYSQTEPAEKVWPFIRWDAPVSVPIEGACLNGAEPTFTLHVFTKDRLQGATVVERAEDQCIRIIREARRVMHRNRLAIPGGSLRTRCPSARIIQDGDEAGAFHGIINVAARGFA